VTAIPQLTPALQNTFLLRLGEAEGTQDGAALPRENLLCRQGADGFIEVCQIDVGLPRQRNEQAFYL
jgi:hypothetical protein